MKDFDKFIALHKEKLFAVAEKNTRRNKDGRAVISKDDNWRNEDEWDNYYEELNAREENSTARSMVR